MEEIKAVVDSGKSMIDYGILGVVCMVTMGICLYLFKSMQTFMKDTITRMTNENAELRKGIQDNTREIIVTQEKIIDLLERN